MKFVVLGGIMLFFSGCWPSYELKYLTYYKAKQNKEPSGDIRIDGIYYKVRPEKEDVKDAVIAMVLYSNGFFMDLGVIPSNGNYEESIKNRIKLVIRDKERFAELNSVWGVYKIEGNELYVQQFQALQTQREVLLKPLLGIFEYKFKIVNQTTLLIEEVNHHPKDEKEIYHFLKVDKKPDSVNFMITNDRVKNKLEHLYHKRN